MKKEEMIYKLEEECQWFAMVAFHSLENDNEKQEV